MRAPLPVRPRQKDQPSVPERLSQQLAVTLDREAPPTRWRFRDLLQLFDGIDLFAIHFAYDVARLEAEASGRRIAIDIDDCRALDVSVEAEPLCEPRRQVGNFGPCEWAASADSDLGDISALRRTDQFDADRL